MSNPAQRWTTAIALIVALAVAGCGIGRATSAPGPVESSAPWHTAPVSKPPSTFPPVPSDPPPTVGPAPMGLAAGDWIGVWTGEEINEFGVAAAETVLMADGSFTNLTIDPSFGSAVRLWGTWRIVAGAEPFVRFEIEGYEPTEFCGPLGCTPVRRPPGVSQQFVFLDRNTVLLWTSDCSSASCKVTYTRSG